jgi:hypothetical protein
MGIAFHELPFGRSQLRLPQSRDRALEGSTHSGYCVHGSHLLPIDHDRRNANRPATRCAIGIATVAVSLSNASPDRYTLNCEEVPPQPANVRSAADRSCAIRTSDLHICSSAGSSLAGPTKQKT